MSCNGTPRMLDFGGFVAILVLLSRASARPPVASAARSLWRLERYGNSCAATRAGDPPPSDTAACYQAHRSALLDGRQPPGRARPLARVLRHARNVASMAWNTDREALDVPWPSWSPTDSAECPNAGGSLCAREPAVGLPAHRRRIERTWGQGSRLQRSVPGSVQVASDPLPPGERWGGASFCASTVSG
jgi:hypothetical protein